MSVVVVLKKKILKLQLVKYTGSWLSYQLLNTFVSSVYKQDWGALYHCLKAIAFYYKRTYETAVQDLCLRGLDSRDHF